MIRAHKIRLNPTPEQDVYLKKAAGITRFAFNWGLARWKEQKAQGVKGSGPMALKAEFNAIKRDQFPWTLEVTKNAVEDGFRRLSASMKNYYDSQKGVRKGRRMGFPKFKSKRRSTSSFTLDYERFRVDGHTLTIQKLATPINWRSVCASRASRSGLRSPVSRENGMPRLQEGLRLATTERPVR